MQRGFLWDLRHVAVSQQLSERSVFFGRSEQKLPSTFRRKSKRFVSLNYRLAGRFLSLASEDLLITSVLWRRIPIYGYKLVWEQSDCAADCEAAACQPLCDSRLSLTSQMGCNCLINPMFVSFYAFYYGLFSLLAISSAGFSPRGEWRSTADSSAARLALLLWGCGVTFCRGCEHRGRRRLVFLMNVSLMYSVWSCLINDNNIFGVIVSVHPDLVMMCLGF